MLIFNTFYQFKLYILLLQQWITKCKQEIKNEKTNLIFMHWCRIKFIFNNRSTNLNSSPTVKGMTTYLPSKQIKKNQKQLASVPLFINQVDMLDIENYSFGNHQMENPPLLTKRLSIQCFHLVWHTSMKFTPLFLLLLSLTNQSNSWSINW